MQVKGLRRTQREIDRLRRRLKLTGAEFADRAAMVVRDTVVRNTQPFGNGKKAWEKSRKAILGDLGRCFQIVSDGRRGRRGVIGSKSEARIWHRSRRGSRGRVARGPRRKIARSVWHDYVDELVAKIGMAKGSVMGGSDARLKGASFARWAKRWDKAGDATRRRGLGGAVWKFSADPAHVASSYVLGERGVRRVMRWKEKNLERYLRRRVLRDMKRTERRVNAP